MKNNFFTICFLLAYIFTNIGLKALADSSVSIPDNLDPGVIGNDNINSFKNSDYQIKQPSKSNLQMDKDLKTLQYNIDISKGKQENPEFFVNKIVVSGNTVIKEKKLKKMTRSLEGKKIRINDLIDLCNQITNYYQKRGYITSRAKLLTQRVDNGLVEITIDEGKYGDIEVNGNKWAKAKYLNNILISNGVHKDAVLNVDNLQRSIGEINNKAYIKGNIIINKTKTPDLHDIVLEVKDRLPLNFSVDWNNLGNELTGQQRTFLKLSYDNLTGYGDSLYGGTILGQGNIGAVAGYNIPIGKKGTQLTLGYSFYNVEYGGIYRDIGLKGNWQNYSIGLIQPILRKGKWSVDSSLNFDICDVKQSMNYIENLSTEKLRVLRAGIYTKRNDNNGFWASGIQVSNGLPILDATGDLGYGSSNFVKVSANLNRIQVLPKKCMALLSINGQYTPNNLLSPEKIALGGYNLRGYETASIVGDVGLFGTLELRTPVPFLRRILSERLKPYEDNIKMGYFYDFGILKDNSGFANVLSSKNINYLQAVGVGLHFPVGNLAIVNLDLGFPIGDKALMNQNVRLTFSVTSSLQNLWAWKKNEKTNL